MPPAFFVRLAQSLTMAAGRVRFFSARCPLADECSEAAWKRTGGCSSWTSEEEARHKLLEHLLRSGRHAVTRPVGYEVDMQDIVNFAEISKEEYSAAECEAWEQQEAGILQIIITSIAVISI